MRYIEFINGLIKEQVLKTKNIVLFGQNISAGSCLGGLTKNIKVNKGRYIINTPNSENSLVGVGFGMMIGGVSSIFFMKQLDFLLLGLDHLVNTYNFIRINKPKASFTIMPIIVDSGYQGMQSSHNNLGDFCSIARVSGYTITNKHDAERIIRTQLIRPGFRIIGVSQRLFNREILSFKDVLYHEKEYKMFQYLNGRDITIVCFNLSLPQGIEMHNKLKEKGIASSLFNVNSVTPIKWDRIIESVNSTKKLIVIDDSKSENLSCYSLLAEVINKCHLSNYLVIKRGFENNSWLWPNKDELSINYDEIVRKILTQAPKKKSS